MVSQEILRVVRFRPYRKGMGPVFILKVWDTNRRDASGKWILRYRFSKGEARDQNAVGNPAVWNVIFEGSDFSCSPLHAVDSDETVKAIMGFLTLLPGDTDREYFENYSAQQMDFAQCHAEAVAMVVMEKFGE